MSIYRDGLIPQAETSHARRWRLSRGQSRFPDSALVSYRLAEHESGVLPGLADHEIAIAKLQQIIGDRNELQLITMATQHCFPALGFLLLSAAPIAYGADSQLAPIRITPERRQLIGLNSRPWCERTSATARRHRQYRARRTARRLRADPFRRMDRKGVRQSDLSARQPRPAVVHDLQPGPREHRERISARHRGAQAR